MKKAEESQKMVLKDHYDTLSDEDKVRFRTAYMEESGMPYTTFYYKLRSDSFRPLEKQLFLSMIVNYQSPLVQRKIS